ncbi:hypothetical protein NQ314_020082 [Rhamnusium bicolor]|uniref:Mab-21-like nucleotidyltransferase domain-containing protein n=1 Tax=Rhamnusium bicolor TaxID=1586634 RepID=A0AAV8WMN1_9CUCU|nr:hypothetical protein NQ314_020082 [Rhamnusium bicolor]
MNDLTKYNKIDSVLHLVHNQYVALSEYEIRRNKIILDYKDTLFNLLYTGVVFGGSYYDDLKVGSPNEYDIDLLLIFPDEQPEIIASTKPGFVHVSLKNKTKSAV